MNELLPCPFCRGKPAYYGKEQALVTCQICGAQAYTKEWNRRPVTQEEAGLRDAFVQGAKWWEFESRGATMWQSDQQKAWDEAERWAANGSLGILDPLTRPAPKESAPDGGLREAYVHGRLKSFGQGNQGDLTTYKEKVDAEADAMYSFPPASAGTEGMRTAPRPSAWSMLPLPGTEGPVLREALARLFESAKETHERMLRRKSIPISDATAEWEIKAEQEYWDATNQARAALASRPVEGEKK